MPNRFLRSKGNVIWELITDEEGPFYFSFDKKKIYNFWTDYWNLTDEERKIFDKEYPVLARLKNPNVADVESEDGDLEYSE